MEIKVCSKHWIWTFSEYNANNKHRLIWNGYKIEQKISHSLLKTEKLKNHVHQTRPKLRTMNHSASCTHITNPILIKWHMVLSSYWVAQQRFLQILYAKKNHISHSHEMKQTSSIVSEWLPVAQNEKKININK